MAAILTFDLTKTTDLADGYVRVETTEYTIEVPKGWTVGNQTPWGQRTIEAKNQKMTAMTGGGPSKASWDELYQTSLYFIRRENPGKPTPFKLAKSAQGYEAMSFSMLNMAGFADERFVILKNPAGKILALSVKIPDPKLEKELAVAFNRLVRTARIA